MLNTSAFKAVLFDLDGTLLDTLWDFLPILNQFCEEAQRPLVTAEALRPYVSLGSRKMLSYALNITESEENFKTYFERFIKIYEENIANKTKPFDGVIETLTLLNHQQMVWGIVTNKLTYLTQKLLTHFDFSQQSACLVCGDTTPYCKPHPAPLLFASEYLKIEPQHILFVGDSINDIAAARAANMPSVLVNYGYLPYDGSEKTWGADYKVDTPNQILQLI